MVGHTHNSVASFTDSAFHLRFHNVSAKLILDPQSKTKKRELDVALCAFNASSNPLGNSHFL